MIFIDATFNEPTQSNISRKQNKTTDGIVVSVHTNLDDYMRTVQSVLMYNINSACSMIAGHPLFK